MDEVSRNDGAVKVFDMLLMSVFAMSRLGGWRAVGRVTDSCVLCSAQRNQKKISAIRFSSPPMGAGQNERPSDENPLPGKV